MTTANMTSGSKITVNGKKYTVVSVADGTVALTGSRGGDAWMVRNVKSGNWYIGHSDRSPVRVESVSL